MSLQFFDAIVVAMRLETPHIVSFEVGSVDGSPLPPAPPGSHVDLQFDNCLQRPYSVVSDLRGRYLLAVRRAEKSRGCSVHICDRMRIGDRLRVSAPKNQFELKTDAPHTILIAGGIGITPLLPMARQLAAENRSWELHLAVKDKAQTPFSSELEAMGPQVQIYETGSGIRPDLEALVNNAQSGSHFYCCGPQGMLDQFVSVTSRLESDRIHLERFEAVVSFRDAGTFEVELAKSRLSFNVAADQTILDVLLKAGIPLDYSCSQGICGSCSVGLLSGEADHRDEVLSEFERERNDQIMVCCSRARGDRLVLDL